MTREAPTVRYDRSSDVLYISTQPGKHGIARESLPGVLWRYEPEHGGIVGVTVLDFSHYWQSRRNDLANDLVSHLNISLRKAKSLLPISS